MTTHTHKFHTCNYTSIRSLVVGIIPGLTDSDLDPVRLKRADT